MKKSNYYPLLAVILVAILSVWYLIATSNNQTFYNQIVISGSSSGINILQPIIDEFQEEYRFIEVKALPGSSSGEGLKSLDKSLSNVVVMARDLTKEEIIKYPNAQYLALLDDLLVLAVHPSVTVTHLNTDEIQKIFTGEFTNWNQVGGDNAQIVLLDREESESSKILLREKILGDLIVTDKAIELHSASSMNSALQTTPYSLGQTSLGIINAEQLNIEPIAIDSYHPTIVNYELGKYVLIRNYGIAYNKNEHDANVLRFIDFIQEHIKELEKNGFITK